jgi:hypothetical protein
MVGSDRQVRGKLQQEYRKTLLPAGRQGIPGQARNDKPRKTYVVIYNINRKGENS